MAPNKNEHTRSTIGFVAKIPQDQILFDSATTAVVTATYTVLESTSFTKYGVTKKTVRDSVLLAP